MEQKVLATLYDRLFDAIAYSPDGKSTGIDKAHTKLQMAKNLVMNPADFTNALSPINPGMTANQNAAEAFSAFVDSIPVSDSFEWQDSGKTVSNAYRQIVNGANTNSQPDPAQEEIYKKAKEFLTKEVSITDFMGNKTTSAGPTAIAKAYDDNQTAYINAVVGFRTAYNGYDLSQTADQRAWNAVAPALQNNVNQAWNKWVNEGKAQVEQARAALQSTINNAVRAAIMQAQGLVSDAKLLPSSLPAGNPWLLSYALSSNWCDASAQATTLTLRSSYLNETSSSEASSYAAGGSGTYGLWSFGGSASHSSAENHSHMDAQNFELSAELIQVRIMRPWFDPTLLTMSGWWLDGYDKDGVSSLLLPLVPVSLIVARNVKITADFSEEDKSHFESQSSAKASVGWGPFSVSGSYSRSSSKDTFSSKLNGGTLSLPGLQVVAIASSLTPLCPPMAAPQVAASGTA